MESNDPAVKVKTESTSSEPDNWSAIADYIKSEEYPDEFEIGRTLDLPHSQSDEPHSIPLKKRKYEENPRIEWNGNQENNQSLKRCKNSNISNESLHSESTQIFSEKTIENHLENDASSRLTNEEIVKNGEVLQNQRNQHVKIKCNLCYFIITGRRTFLKHLAFAHKISSRKVDKKKAVIPDDVTNYCSMQIKQENAEEDTTTESTKNIPLPPSTMDDNGKPILEVPNICSGNIENVAEEKPLINRSLSRKKLSKHKTETRRNLRKHVSYHRRKNLEKCRYCSFHCQDQIQLTWHLMEHVEAQSRHKENEFSITGANNDSNAAQALESDKIAMKSSELQYSREPKKTNMQSSSHGSDKKVGIRNMALKEESSESNCDNSKTQTDLFNDGMTSDLHRNVGQGNPRITITITASNNDGNLKEALISELLKSFNSKSKPKKTKKTVQEINSQEQLSVSNNVFGLFEDVDSLRSSEELSGRKMDEASDESKTNASPHRLQENSCNPKMNSANETFIKSKSAPDYTDSRLIQMSCSNEQAQSESIINTRDQEHLQVNTNSMLSSNCIIEHSVAQTVGVDQENSDTVQQQERSGSSNEQPSFQDVEKENVEVSHKSESCIQQNSNEQDLETSSSHKETDLREQQVCDKTDMFNNNIQEVSQTVNQEYAEELEDSCQDDAKCQQGSEISNPDEKLNQGTWEVHSNICNKNDSIKPVQQTNTVNELRKNCKLNGLKEVTNVLEKLDPNCSQNFEEGSSNESFNHEIVGDSGNVDANGSIQEVPQSGIPLGQNPQELPNEFVPHKSPPNELEFPQEHNNENCDKESTLSSCNEQMKIDSRTVDINLSHTQRDIETVNIAETNKVNINILQNVKVNLNLISARDQTVVNNSIPETSKCDSSNIQLSAESTQIEENASGSSSQSIKNDLLVLQKHIDKNNVDSLEYVNRSGLSVSSSNTQAGASTHNTQNDNIQIDIASSCLNDKHLLEGMEIFNLNNLDMYRASKVRKYHKRNNSDNPCKLLSSQQTIKTNSCQSQGNFNHLGNNNENYELNQFNVHNDPQSSSKLNHQSDLILKMNPSTSGNSKIDLDSNDKISDCFLTEVSTDNQEALGISIYESITNSLMRVDFQQLSETHQDKVTLEDLYLIVDQEILDTADNSEEAGVFSSTIDNGKVVDHPTQVFFEDTDEDWLSKEFAYNFNYLSETFDGDKPNERSSGSEKCGDGINSLQELMDKENDKQKQVLNNASVSATTKTDINKGDGGSLIECETDPTSMQDFHLDIINKSFLIENEAQQKMLTSVPIYFCDKCSARDEDPFCEKCNVTKIKMKHESFFKCPICSKKYRSRWAAQCHLRNNPSCVKSINSITCPFCLEKICIDTTSLLVHIKKHIEKVGKFNRCPLCNILSSRKSDLLRHIKDIHYKYTKDRKVLQKSQFDRLEKQPLTPDNNIKSMKVNENTNIPETSSLPTGNINQSNGVTSEKQLPKKLYSIVEVDPTIVQQKEIPRPKPTTDVNAEFQCRHCPTVLPQKSLFYYHMSLHFASKGIQCPVCTFRTSKSEIIKHLLCHVTSSDDTFKCPICDTVKRNAENIHDHLKVAHSRALFKKHDSICQSRRSCIGMCS